MKTVTRFLIIIFLLTNFLACENNEDKEKISELENKIAQLETELKEKNELLEEKNNISILENKFIGSWEIIPDPNRNDNSMVGIVCELEKYSNTEETFVFHLFTGHELILSVQDENTLVGRNANMIVEYDNASDELVLSIPNSSNWRFKKLN